MYRLFFFCLLLSLNEAIGFRWHRPIYRPQSWHKPLAPWHVHKQPTTIHNPNQHTRPCVQHEEQKPITIKPDVKEDVIEKEDPVTENEGPVTGKENLVTEKEDPVTEKEDKTPTPFKEEGENQEETNQIPEKTFEYLGNKTVSDNKVNKNFCKIHSKEKALEYFTTKHYKLIIPLKGYDADNINVKIINNMIYIKADIPDVDIDVRFSDDNKIFEAIYKLPDIVDPKKVFWDHKNGRLEITFNYKMQFNIEIVKSCDRDYIVDNEIRAVPHMEGDAIIKIFGE